MNFKESLIPDLVGKKLFVTTATIILLLNPVIIFSPVSSYGSTSNDNDNGASDEDDVDFNTIGYKLASPCMEAKTLDTIDEDLDSASKRETLEMCHSNMLYLKGQCETSFSLMENFCKSGGEMMVDEYLEFYSLENEPRPNIPEWIDDEEENEEKDTDNADNTDNANEAQTTDFSVYEDPQGRFTIEYPSDWYVNEEPFERIKDIVVQFDSSEPDIAYGTDITMPSVWIMVRNLLPDEISLERLSNKLVNNYAEGFTIQESENTTLSGIPAHTISYDKSGGATKQLWTLHNSNVFIITYNAHSHDYDTYLPLFQQMADSFHITK